MVFVKVFIGTFKWAALQAAKRSENNGRVKVIEGFAEVCFNVRHKAFEQM